MITETGAALVLAFNDMLRMAIIFVPRLIGALLVLLIGVLVGRAVGALVTRALRALRFDRIADRAEIDDLLQNAGVRMDPAAIVGALAKWAIYLIFFQAAASTLGIPQLTAILNQIIAYIPRVAVALFILLIGALVANLLAGLVRGALAGARDGSGRLLATLARWGVLTVAVVAALSQLEVAPVIVNSLWIVLIAAAGLALAIAFGLGAREAAGSLAIGQLIKGDVQPGMRISVDEEGGIVEAVGPLYTTLRIQGGRVKIPNADLARRVVVVGDEAAPLTPGQTRPPSRDR
jgi:small-conductance mechanosensitive channel